MSPLKKGDLLEKETSDRSEQAVETVEEVILFKSNPPVGGLIRS